MLGAKASGISRCGLGQGYPLLQNAAVPHSSSTCIQSPPKVYEDSLMIHAYVASPACTSGRTTSLDAGPLGYK